MELAIKQVQHTMCAFAPLCIKIAESAMQGPNVFLGMVGGGDDRDHATECSYVVIFWRTAVLSKRYMMIG